MSELRHHSIRNRVRSLEKELSEIDEMKETKIISSRRANIIDKLQQLYVHGIRVEFSRLMGQNFDFAFTDSRGTFYVYHPQSPAEIIQLKVMREIISVVNNNTLPTMTLGEFLVLAENSFADGREAYRQLREKQRLYQTHPLASKDILK